METVLRRHSLTPYWLNPDAVTHTPRYEWKGITYDAVDRTSDAERAADMAAHPSTRLYRQIKSWTVNPGAYSAFTGEHGRQGQHVPEAYLDDRRDLRGTRVKMLCRIGNLPVMAKTARDRGWQRAHGTCYVCNNPVVETIHHFLMDCPAYDHLRHKLITDVRGALGRTHGTVDTAAFDAMNDTDKSAILLGQRTGDPFVDARIDRTCKKYLRKFWNTRNPTTTRINNILNIKYDIFNTNIARI